MKVLKIAAIVLFLLVAIPVLVLLACHLRPGEGDIIASVEIARPRDQVWSWMTEPEKLTQWIGWLAAVESDSTSPREGVGHREVWVMHNPDMPNAPMRIPATFTGWDPPRSMSGRISVPELFDGEFSYTVEDLGGRTRVSQVSRWRYHGISWLMEPLVTPEARKKMVTDFGTLKAKAEAAPAAGS